MSAERDPEQENEQEDVADDEPQTIIKQGYMTKQGGSVKNWKKRWFVLTDKYIKYYKTEKIQNATPIGLVFLRSVSKIDRGVDGPNGTIDAFAMHTPERVYIFACQNNREVGAWLDAVKPYVKLTGKVADVIKTGFLTKQGGSFKSWKRRYFVLRSDKLLYYHKDDKDPLSVGVIDLEKCTEIVCVPNIKYNHQFAFDIITPQRTFGLFAPTFADLEAWATTLGGLLGMTITIPTPEEAAQTPAGGAPANADDAQGDGADLAGAPSPAIDNAADDVNNLTISEGSIKEGFLTKQGGTFKTWKRRLFRLRDTSLDYYKEPKDAQAQGTIDLTKVVSVEASTKKGKPFMFEVATKTRVFLISAAAEEEMNDWIVAIRGVLATLPPPVDDAPGDDAGGDDD